MSNKNLQSESDEVIPIEWEEKDRLIPALQVLTGEITGEEFLKTPAISRSSIALGEIQRFCTGCENQDEHGVCIFGRHDQTRYAGRKWCGWAQKDGRSGCMTKDGFKETD